MAFAAVAQIIAVAASAESQRRQAKAQKRAASKQEKMQIAQAEEVQKQADYRQKQMAREAAQLRARQTAGFAASGVKIGTGSPLLVYADAASQYQQDMAEIGRQGSVQASQYYSAAGLYKDQGKAAMTAGHIGAGATALGGMGQISSDYGWFNSTRTNNGQNNKFLQYGRY